MAMSFDERVLEQTIGALELFGIYLGDRLGLYAPLRDGEAADAGELAERCGIHPRYAREWLEQQAVAGVLEVDDSRARTPSARATGCPTAHAAVLVDAERPGAPRAARAHDRGHRRRARGGRRRRTGAARGVPYARYGADFRHGQGGINRPAFSTSARRGVDAGGRRRSSRRLARGGRVADLGCGQGWSAIAVARAFPHARGAGASTTTRRRSRTRARHAAAAGARVRFECADAARSRSHGPFDVGAAARGAARPRAPGRGARRRARGARRRTASCSSPTRRSPDVHGAGRRRSSA